MSVGSFFLSALYSFHKFFVQFSPRHLRLRWLICFAPLFHVGFVACFISLRFLNCDYSTFIRDRCCCNFSEYWDSNDALMHRFRINHIFAESSSSLNSIWHKRYVRTTHFYDKKSIFRFFVPNYLRVGDVPSQFISKMSIPANVRDNNGKKLVYGIREYMVSPSLSSLWCIKCKMPQFFRVGVNGFQLVYCRETTCVVTQLDERLSVCLRACVCLWIYLFDYYVLPLLLLLVLVIVVCRFFFCVCFLIDFGLFNNSINFLFFSPQFSSAHSDRYMERRIFVDAAQSQHLVFIFMIQLKYCNWFFQLVPFDTVSFKSVLFFMAGATFRSLFIKYIVNT